MINKGNSKDDEKLTIMPTNGQEYRILDTEKTKKKTNVSKLKRNGSMNIKTALT